MRLVVRKILKNVLTLLVLIYHQKNSIILRFVDSSNAETRITLDKIVAHFERNIMIFKMHYYFLLIVLFVSAIYSEKNNKDLKWCVGWDDGITTRRIIAEKYMFGLSLDVRSFWGYLAEPESAPDSLDDILWDFDMPISVTIIYDFRLNESISVGPYLRVGTTIKNSEIDNHIWLKCAGRFSTILLERLLLEYKIGISIYNVDGYISNNDNRYKMMTWGLDIYGDFRQTLGILLLI